MSALGRLVGSVPLFVAAVACGPESLSLGYDEPVVNSGTMPSGQVWSCTGVGCPYGDCDNEEFFSDVDCDDVYPGPLSDQSLFCQPGEEDDYCVTVGIDISRDDWVVDCGGGLAIAERCIRGCQTSSSGLAECL